MKSQITLVLIALSLSFGSLAQNDSVRYRYLYNDPYDIPKYSVYLTPGVLQMSGMNLINGGLGGGFNAMIADRIVLEGEGFYSLYYDLNAFQQSIQEDYTHPDLPDRSIDQEFRPASFLQGSVGVVLSDQSRTENTLIGLASAQTGNLIITTVMPVDYINRRTIAVRAGVGRYSTKYTPGHSSSDDKFLEADDGTRFYQTGHVAYPDITYQDDGFDPYWDRTDVFYDSVATTDQSLAGWSTQVTGMIATFGIVVCNIKNLGLETDFGKRAVRSKSSFYLDFMYGVHLEASPIQFYESDASTRSDIGTNVRNYDVMGAGENKIEMLPFGFRVGYYGQGLARASLKKYAEQDELSRLFNMGYRVEFGLLPGPKLKTYYFNLGLSWPLVAF